MPWLEYSMSYLLKTDADPDVVKQVVCRHSQKVVCFPNSHYNSHYTGSGEYIINLGHYEDRVGALSNAAELVAKDLRNSNIKANAKVKEIFPCRYVIG